MEGECFNSTPSTIAGVSITLFGTQKIKGNEKVIQGVEV